MISKEDPDGSARILARDFDFVITLSDRARAECPTFPLVELAHWQFDDPLAEVDPAKQKRLFRALRDQMVQRIRLFALVQSRFVSVDTNARDNTRSQADFV